MADAKYSFEIRNSRDLFRKLEADFGDFQQSPDSSRHAINCALTAWHLIDWRFYEKHNRPPKHNGQEMSKWRQEFYKDCNELKYLGSIANGSKHFELERNPGEISDTRLQKGAFSPAFSDDYNVYALYIIVDSEKIRFLDVMKNVVDFWKRHFANHP